MTTIAEWDIYQTYRLLDQTLLKVTHNTLGHNYVVMNTQDTCEHFDGRYH